MTYLTASADCPNCGGNHKGRPYCTYENGAHCFSCGYTKKYDRTFSVLESRIIEIPGIPECIYNPSRFSLQNLIWLNKYFITEKQIRDYRIAEAPDGALIFCSIVNGKVVHYQKRYNTTPRRILSYGPKTPSISSTRASTIVLVEDYLSHIRVGELFDTACLWGTKATYEFLSSLLAYDKILVWLDNDAHKETNSGQEAAKKICKTLDSILNYKLRRFGFGGIKLPVIENITTDCDPKVYSPSELRLILGVNRYEHTIKIQQQAFDGHSRRVCIRSLRS